MKRTGSKKSEPLSVQVRRKAEKEKEDEEIQEEDKGTFAKGSISTGSTLLDLAISGGRYREGGLPCGIFVEIFGPNGSGKTVLLSEIAGDVQRQGGDIIFHDPEARLNTSFAKIFGLDIKEENYYMPNTVPEIFRAVEEWEVEDENAVNGIFADSLAALSTDLEMGNKEGDKMGMRRPKEFSEGLRKICRIIRQKNYLMVCSNQIRENIDAGQWGQKYTSPGGLAIGFYSSLRLRTSFGKVKTIKKEKKIHGKAVTRIVGINIDVEVFKSSIWKPHRSAPVSIIFDYGIDDIRQNLQFIKDHTRNTMYMVGEKKLNTSLEASIRMIEDENLEKELREEVIELWTDIESEFDSNRKVRVR